MRFLIEARALSEAERIREKYERMMSNEIVELQRSCPHTQASNWTDERWTLGHPTGRRVKYCLHCGKVLDVHDPDRSNFTDPFNVVEREEEMERTILFYQQISCK